MLRPLRDYLSPKDPKSSPLLCATKDHYFARVSGLGMTNFGETRWITSEEANVEHLLDVFTTIDGDSDGVWEACTNFVKHLAWHENRFSVLRLKVEGLPDGHRSKPGCLLELSKSFDFVGNWAECKRLLTQVLKLRIEGGSDREVATTLMELSNTNWLLNLYKEGIQQAREASEILERLGETTGQVHCLNRLALLLRGDGQLDAAEVAASRAIRLIAEKDNPFRACESHHILGMVYQSGGEREKAIHQYELALKIGSSLNWHHILLWVHYSLGELFCDESKFDDANAHIEQAKSHVERERNRGCVMELQARVWFKERRLEEARSEAFRAIDILEKLGAGKDLERCKELLRKIEKKFNRTVASGRSGSNCEYLGSGKLCYFLHVLTLYPKFREPTCGIDGCVDFPNSSSRTSRSAFRNLLQYDYFLHSTLCQYPLLAHVFSHLYRPLSPSLFCILNCLFACPYHGSFAFIFFVRFPVTFCTNDVTISFEVSSP